MWDVVRKDGGRKDGASLWMSHLRFWKHFHTTFTPPQTHVTQISSVDASANREAGAGAGGGECGEAVITSGLRHSSQTKEGRVLLERCLEEIGHFSPGPKRPRKLLPPRSQRILGLEMEL